MALNGQHIVYFMSVCVSATPIPDQSFEVRSIAFVSLFLVGHVFARNFVYKTISKPTKPPLDLPCHVLSHQTHPTPVRYSASHPSSYPPPSPSPRTTRTPHPPPATPPPPSPPPSPPTTTSNRRKRSWESISSPSLLKRSTVTFHTRLVVRPTNPGVAPVFSSSSGVGVKANPCTSIGTQELRCHAYLSGNKMPSTSPPTIVGSMESGGSSSAPVYPFYAHDSRTTAYMTSTAVPGTPDYMMSIVASHKFETHSFEVSVLFGTFFFL